MNVVKLARNVAAKIAQNEDLDILSKSLFGQGVNVFMDSLGTEKTIDKQFLTENKLSGLCPYALVGGLLDEDGPVTDGDEFEVGVVFVIDASINADGTQINTAIPLKAADGVFDYAAGDKLADLVEALKIAVADEVGANLETISTAYTNGEQYPIQYAQITLNYTTEQTF